MIRRTQGPACWLAVVRRRQVGTAFAQRVATALVQRGSVAVTTPVEAAPPPVAMAEKPRSPPRVRARPPPPRSRRRASRRARSSSARRSEADRNRGPARTDPSRHRLRAGPAADQAGAHRRNRRRDAADRRGVPRPRTAGAHQPFGALAHTRNTGGSDARGLQAPKSRWNKENVPAYESIVSACAAAVEGEIENIAMYDRLMKLELPEDVEQTFTYLRRASLENHLPAFRRCAQR